MKVIGLLRKPLAFEGRFTQIPNSWARDKKIGYRAKGILLLLMSHQSGWRITLEALAEDSPDGITAVRTAITQLEEAGYLHREKVRDSQNRIIGSEWVISDPDSDNEPSLDFLTLENLTSENLTLENLTHKNTITKNTITKKTNKDTDEQFERFWKSYPRRIAKGSAKTAFEKALKKIEFEDLIVAVENYASNPDLPDLQFIPHPTTWLNQERWNDEIESLGTMAVAKDIIARSKQLESLRNPELES